MHLSPTTSSWKSTLIAGLTAASQADRTRLQNLQDAVNVMRTACAEADTIAPLEHDLEMVKRPVEMVDTVMTLLITMVADAETPANIDYWTDTIVGPLTRGEFESLGHLADRLPGHLVMIDERLRVAKSHYALCNKRTPAPTPPPTDVASLLARRQFGRPTQATA